MDGFLGSAVYDESGKELLNWRKFEGRVPFEYLRDPSILPAILDPFQRDNSEIFCYEFSKNRLWVVMKARLSSDVWGMLKRSLHVSEEVDLRAFSEEIARQRARKELLDRGRSAEQREALRERNRKLQEGSDNEE